MNDDESVYDEFAEVTFDIEWLQKAWLILGELWYHEEAGAFLYPLSEGDLGRVLYLDYMQQIETPMDFTTIKQKFYNRQYDSVASFLYDMRLVFDNCKIYNHHTSELYKVACNLERLFF